MLINAFRVLQFYSSTDLGKSGSPDFNLFLIILKHIVMLVMLVVFYEYK